MPWKIPNLRSVFEGMAAVLEQELQRINLDVDPDAISRSVRSNHGLLSIILRYQP